MGEWALFGIGLAKFGCVILFAALYSIAGRDKTPKWLRRFVAPAILLIGVQMINWQINWMTLVAYPIMAIGLSIGYGADLILDKIKKRALCALVICSAGIPLVVSTGHYPLLILQYIIGISASITLGCFNDLDAPTEEFYIGLLTTVMMPFMI